MMKKTLVLLAGCLLAGTATAQEEDNIWERPENKAVIVVPETGYDRDNVVKTADGRLSVLKVSAGPAWITSKMYYTERSYIKNQGGYELAVNYELVGRKGWGFTADLNYNRTKYDGLSDISLVHVGPGASYSGIVDDRWRLSIQMGAGMAIYEESFKMYYNYYGSSQYTEVGFGLTSRLGAEYMLSKKWGIGLDLSSSVALLRNETGISLPDNETYGIAHSALLFGLRYYY